MSVFRKHIKKLRRIAMIMAILPNILLLNACLEGDGSLCNGPGRVLAIDIDQSLTTGFYNGKTVTYEVLLNGQVDTVIYTLSTDTLVDWVDPCSAYCDQLAEILNVGFHSDKSDFDLTLAITSCDNNWIEFQGKKYIEDGSRTSKLKISEKGLVAYNHEPEFHFKIIE